MCSTTPKDVSRRGSQCFSIFEALILEIQGLDTGTQGLNQSPNKEVSRP